MPVRKTLRGSFAGALLLSAALGANVPGGGTGTGPNVTVTDNGATVVLSNGIVSVTVVKSNGNLSSFSFNGTNLLAGGHGGGSFYVDGSGGPTLTNTVYTLTVDPATNGGAQAEVWLQSTQSPMDAGLYYDLLRGQQGIYDTFVLSHPASYPVYPGAELRTNMYVGSIFDWVCVDPYRFRQMASPNDTTVAVTGAPPEVMQFTSGIYNGTTGCKYSYSEPLGPANAYGWASTTTRYGIWQTFPSHEYLDGGPMHRELTAHLGNTLLDMFGGGHYGFGSTPTVPAGAEAFKVFGPAFIYANQYGGTAVNVSAYAQALFADAQAQAAAEQSAWPYAWFNPQPPAGISGALYPQKPARGGVSGTLAINDPYDAGASPAGLWVGLAPDDGGVDFQQQYLTYQFWVQTGPGGAFSIPNVLPGTYDLWAFGPGAAGTFHQAAVTVVAGQASALGTLTWTPPRLGPTVWQLGVPDRSSEEFNNGEHGVAPYGGVLPAYAGGAPYNSPTQWAAFFAYPDQYPNGVSYTVGVSSDASDWNYCQPTMLNAAAYVGSASKIYFNLAQAPAAGAQARLYIAFAAVASAACILTINGVVQTGAVTVSTDGVNAASVANPSTGFYPANVSFDVITRLGSNGAWGDAIYNFPATSLKAGMNEVDIGMRPTGGAGSGNGFEYDYVRLEMTGYSPTPTPSPAATTRSPTPTATPSATSSATPSVIPSASPSPVPSSTRSPASSVTPSPPLSRTPTELASATASPVATATPTASGTVSPAATAAITPLASATPSVTPSVTPSATANATLTPVSSPAPTAVDTASATLTVVATLASTASASPTATATGTPPSNGMVTPTATPAPFNAPTPTTTPPSAAASATALGGSPGGPLAILGLLAAPDPDPDRVLVDLSGQADKVELTIWSVALRRLDSVTLGPLGPGWVALPLPAACLAHAAPGAYYCSVRAWRGAASTPPKIGRFFVLR